MCVGKYLSCALLTCKIQWGLNCYGIKGEFDKSRRFNTSHPDMQREYLKFLNGMSKLNIRTFTSTVRRYVEVDIDRQENVDEPDKIMSDDD